MHGSIAIASSKVDSEELKRAALLFDTVVIHRLNESTETLRHIEDSGMVERMMAEMAERDHETGYNLKELLARSRSAHEAPRHAKGSDEMLRLKERGVIADEDEFLRSVLGEEAAEESKMGELLRFIVLNSEKSVRSESGLTDWEKTDHEAISSEAADSNCRSVAQRLQSEANIDAVPLAIGSNANLDQLFKGGRTPTMHILLNAIPEPEPYTTSWEAILDFRDDKDARGKLAQLRSWIIDMSRTDLSPNDITTKLEALRYEYEQHMKLHKMKFRAGILQTVVVATAEFAENLAKLQLGKLAKGLFTCQEAKLALLEAELTAPGRELAYLYQVQRTFSK